MFACTEYRKNMQEDLAALWKVWVPATLLNFAFMVCSQKLETIWDTIIFLAAHIKTFGIIKISQCGHASHVLQQLRYFGHVFYP
jgi:hypothetical protein